MPEITFILPHWVYWGGIFGVPLALIWVMRRNPSRRRTSDYSLLLGYFLLLVGGFMGLHRLYLKSWAAAIFIGLFVGIIICNDAARDARNEHSIARNEVAITTYDLEQAQADEETAVVITGLIDTLTSHESRVAELGEAMQFWHRAAFVIALILFGLIILDACLMPRNVRIASERSPPPTEVEAVKMPEDVETANHVDPGPLPWISRLNGWVGEFVTYWTVIAVFVFYYEVIARYVFNSPTIWAHESMYLLFGMQYLLAGGYCLREHAHVRVDVFYLTLSPRAKARCDVITSAFFFIFTLSLMVTGWLFFYDAFVIRESSFTEWAIPHWPIKFALPLGGLLIALQGLVNLLRDIQLLRTASAA